LAVLHDEGREQTAVGNLAGTGRKNHTQIYCQDITWITVALDKIGRHIFVSKLMKGVQILKLFRKTIGIKSQVNDKV